MANSMLKKTEETNNIFFYPRLDQNHIERNQNFKSNASSETEYVSNIHIIVFQNWSETLVWLTEWDFPYMHIPKKVSSNRLCVVMSFFSSAINSIVHVEHHNIIL